MGRGGNRHHVLWTDAQPSQLRFDMHPATPAERSDFFGADGRHKTRRRNAQLVMTKVGPFGKPKSLDCTVERYNGANLKYYSCNTYFHKAKCSMFERSFNHHFECFQSH